MEFAESAPKFKQFSQEDIPSLEQGFRNIAKKFMGLGRGARILINNEDFAIGKSTEENSPLSLLQFYMSLAASGLSADEIDGREGLIQADTLAQKQSLSGLKIIDLGCGGRPYFSVVARKLGATVYTVDILDFEGMMKQYGLKHFLSTGDLENIKNHHIVVDLKKEDSDSIINNISGGEFNFVTESHLASGAERNGREVMFFEGRKFAKNIISPSGIYYDANRQTKLTHAVNL